MLLVVLQPIAPISQVSIFITHLPHQMIDQQWMPILLLTAILSAALVFLFQEQDFQSVPTAVI